MDTKSQPDTEGLAGKIQALVGAHDKILIIDDEAVILDLFREMLDQESYFVDFCGSGEEALEKMRHDAFDLLIIDKNLPGISGLDVVAKAREILPTVESIIITAYPSKESTVLALQTLKVFDYLEKPFPNLLVVKERIEGALAQHRLKQPEPTSSSARASISQDLDGLRSKLLENGGSSKMLDLYVDEIVNRVRMEMELENRSLRQALEGVLRRSEKLGDILRALITQAPSPELKEALSLVTQAQDLANDQLFH